VCERVPAVKARDTATVALVRARSRGWPHFPPRPWAVLHAEYGDLVVQLPTLRHVLAVVESVLEVGADRDLAASTSLRDLMVRPLPLGDPPYDLVVVRSPISMVRVAPGTVIVEHVSATGHDDRVVRPVAEAVPLFWRFMIEKYGVDPAAYARG
jgi:hypothetical protein